MSTRVQAAASGPVMWDSHGRRKQLPSITQSSMTLDKVVEERDNTTLALERKRRKSRRHQRQTESRQSDVIRALISERRATVSTNQRPPFRPSISMTSSQFDDDVFSSSQRRASMLRTLASMDGGGGRSHDRPSLTSVKDELGCGVMTRLGLGREGYSRRPSKTRPGARFRKVARFVAVLFGLWRKHAVRVQNYMESQLEMVDFGHAASDLMFDKTQFKADKEDHISEASKIILTKRPEDRTEDDVKYVQIAFGNYHILAEYPLRMKRLIAERSWIGRYDTKRVIIRQGHVSRSYYIILTGSVVVSCMDESGISKTLCFLGRGENFGELGIINNALRSATVITREPTELLIIHEEDYIDIFMSGGLGNPNDTFLQSLSFLKDWPISLLANNTLNCFQSFFRRGVVLVYDSCMCDWMVIVKSGSCSVLKKLRNVHPTKPPLLYGGDEEGLTEEQHRDIIAERLAEEDARVGESNSEAYRSQLLRDLGLGLPLHGVAPGPDPGQAGPRSPRPLSHLPQPRQPIGDNKSPDDLVTSSSHQQTDTQSAAPKLFTLDRETTRMVALAPLITIDEDQNISSGVAKATQVSRETVEATGDMKLIKAQSTLSVKSVRRLSMLDTRGGAGEMTDSSNSDKRAWFTRERTGSISNKTAQTNVSSRMARHKKNKKQKLVNDRKTIVEQINDQYLNAADDEDANFKDPLFVQIQVLTKGNTFGLLELLHEDQPRLSLVSNGSECIFIRKKFYADNMSRALKHRLSKELSPLPSDEQLQASLQVHVDWLQAKFEAITRALHHCQHQHALRRKLPFLPD